MCPGCPEKLAGCPAATAWHFFLGRRRECRPLDRPARLQMQSQGSHEQNPAGQDFEEQAMPVHYEKKNHVGWLTLSRPQARNCWGEDFNDEIVRLCDEMAADKDVRIAVVTGDEAGGAF